MSNCPEYDRLNTQATQVLADLAQTAITLLDVYRCLKTPEVMRLDKRLEELVGAKERVFGALRQHVNEHKCQPYSLGPALDTKPNQAA